MYDFEKMTEKEIFDTLESLKLRGHKVILNFSDGSEIHSFEGEIVRFNYYFVRLKVKNREIGFNLKFLISGKEVE